MPKVSTHWRTTSSGKRIKVEEHERAKGVGGSAAAFDSAVSATSEVSDHDPFDSGLPKDPIGLDRYETEALKDSYTEAALFSSPALGEHQDGSNDFESAEDLELTKEAREALDRQVVKGWNEMDEDLRDELIKRDVNIKQWGHDYWFTREGHGAGFWDRGDETYGPGNKERLTEFAKAQGEGGTFFRVGDDQVDFDDAER